MIKGTEIGSVHWLHLIWEQVALICQMNITGLRKQKCPSKLVQTDTVVLYLAVPSSNLDRDIKSDRFLVSLHANVWVVLQNWVKTASTAF
jgi:hypothetical protein